MKKPIILTVDDDPEVLQAISHDLRKAYGDRFRVMRVDSGTRAMDILRQIKLSNEIVALMLVDQRMPGLSGVDLLTDALPIFPTAKRALLTAYADTDAAIKAINDIHLDYYLMKPWDPPETHLYPVLDDLLDDWLSGYHPEFDGVRIIGHRWSPESHEVRNFLARNEVPFRWFNIESDPESAELLALASPNAQSFPVVIFPDGSVRECPSNEEIAAQLGLRGHAEVPLYDLAIVGAGPSGLAAAVYGASEGLKTIILEREAAGGQAGTSSRIENYLGFPSGLSGADLARRALTQARRFGADLLLTQTTRGLSTQDGSFGLRLGDDSEVRAHSVILATGVSYRRLDAPGVESLTGRGVYYGAAAVDIRSIDDADVFIVGGANSAGQAAIFFGARAKSITMIVRGTSLSASMSHYLLERIEHTANIHVLYQTAVEEAIGEEHLEALRLKNASTGESTEVPASSLFVFIGAQPHTDRLDGTVIRDERGFLLTGPDLLAAGRPKTWHLERDPFLLETSVPGVFAAGDVRHGSGKRVATAVGEGATAVMSIWQYRQSVGL
jgi:thioredoxin reductase (NADPH)